MIIKKISKNLSINAQNIVGWRSSKKIIVIESDDWGSIRMPTKAAYESLLQKGIPVDKCPYNSNDSLETAEDLSALFDVFSGIKDKNGNPLKLTANTVMANPDFEKIRESQFSAYFYEDFVSTYRRLSNDKGAYNLIREGISSGLYVPQLHGREHLHVTSWLNALREGDPETRLAFNNQLYGHPSQYFNSTKMSFLSALHARTKDEQEFMNQSLRDASLMFKKIFGFKSESFIAPRYIWNESIESELQNIGIKYIQGLVVQQVPDGVNLKTKTHVFGSKNRHRQTYINRNVFFEPTQNRNFPWADDALKRIEIAFRWGKPAIISMHRLNFMGGLNERNRTDNLLMLANLIKKVQQKHRDVIFMSTNELGKLINNEN